MHARVDPVLSESSFSDPLIYMPPRRRSGMPEPGAALLRREMHGMHEEHEREGREWESGMEAAMDDNLGLRNAAMEPRIEITGLKRRLAYYENAHITPSKRPLPPPKPKGGAPVRRKGGPAAGGLCN